MSSKAKKMVQPAAKKVNPMTVIVNKEIPSPNAVQSLAGKLSSLERKGASLKTTLDDCNEQIVSSIGELQRRRIMVGGGVQIRFDVLRGKASEVVAYMSFDDGRRESGPILVSQLVDMARELITELGS
jgi:hypothetical protein